MGKQSKDFPTKLVYIICIFINVFMHRNAIISAQWPLSTYKSVTGGVRTLYKGSFQSDYQTKHVLRFYISWSFDSHNNLFNLLHWHSVAQLKLLACALCYHYAANVTANIHTDHLDITEIGGVEAGHEVLVRLDEQHAAAGGGPQHAGQLRDVLQTHVE